MAKDKLECIQKQKIKYAEIASGEYKTGKPKKTAGKPKKPKTVAEMVDDYLEHGTDAKAESVGKYRRNLETYVIPYMGKRPAKSIGADDIREWKKWLESQNVGTSAQHHVWKNLTAVFNYAVTSDKRWAEIRMNPLKAVKTPKHVNRRDAYITLHSDDHKSIAENMYTWMKETNHPYMPILIAMLMGLRREEVLGLTTDSITEQDGTLMMNVRWKCKQIAGGGYELFYGTKNGTTRTLPIADPYKPFITRQRIKAEELGCVMKSRIDEKPNGDLILLFPRENGTRRTYNDWNANWKAAQNDYQRYIWGKEAKSVSIENGLYIYPHEMRHLYATWLAESGTPIEVAQTLLGHMTPEMTQHYINIGNKAKREAAETVGNKIAENSKLGFIDRELHKASMVQDIKTV